MIQDSGERVEFATGAVRDIREGKGRCDLLPLEVIAKLFDDPYLNAIARYVDSGDTNYLYDALRCASKKIFPNLSTLAIEVSIHFEEGAKKYGERNWQKGIPAHCYIDSAIRHYLKYLRGDNDERHDRATCWNILCCIWTLDNKPDLNDIPKSDNND